MGKISKLSDYLWSYKINVNPRGKKWLTSSLGLHSSKKIYETNYCWNILLGDPCRRKTNNPNKVLASVKLL